ncbi:MAG: lysylphosphatidylglycerol synthase transmembrane domain-containing protein [Polyangiaceae bacterium]
MTDVDPSVTDASASSLPEGASVAPPEVCAGSTERLPEAVAPKSTSPIGRWGKRVLAVVVAVFVGVTLIRLGRAFDARDLSLRVWPLVVLTAVLVFANFAQAFAWARLLDRLVHRRVARRPVCAIYCAGQLARYTPGKVALVLVRVAGAKRLGLDVRIVASSVGIEVLSWMTVGLLIGTVALGGSRSALGRLGPFVSTYSVPVAVAIVLGMLVLLLVDCRRFPAFALRLLGAKGEGPLLSWPVLGWQAVSWGGCFAQAWLLPLAVGVDGASAWEHLALFVLAPIAGFLAMVAPGGLGVREAVLSMALAGTMGPSRALAIAVLARAAYVASEIIAWLVARGLDRADQLSTGEP